MYPKVLQQLIDSFRLLPGVGAKTAERYAFAVLDMNDEEAESFSEALKEAKVRLKKCRQCDNLTQEELCFVCQDTKRDHDTICVVQHAKDIIAMEKIKEYRGVYHVLGGVIAPSKGILPSDLNIEGLLSRIQKTTKEVIIATNFTLEGETTAMYLAKVLEGRGVLVSRIAHGLPMGGHLDYADELTLIKAFEGRQKVK